MKTSKFFLHVSIYYNTHLHSTSLSTAKYRIFSILCVSLHRTQCWWGEENTFCGYSKYRIARSQWLAPLSAEVCGPQCAKNSMSYAASNVVQRGARMQRHFNVNLEQTLRICRYRYFWSGSRMKSESNYSHGGEIWSCNLQGRRVDCICTVRSSYMSVYNAKRYMPGHSWFV